MLAPSAIEDRAAGRALLVGFSGGLDSTVLLHLLAGTSAARGGLRAIHVDHGLHPDAGAWRGHCEQVCAALHVPLATVRVDVTTGDGFGREAAARNARHAAFEAQLRNEEVLVLAHHRDDQAETFLLRALRASGVDGLASMRPWRRFGRGWLWRPLLAVPRAHLQAYATEHGLEWIEDPSNRDEVLDRNFIRHQVLPLLRSRWPQADAAFAASAQLASEASTLLDQDDARVLAALRGDERADRLDIPGLADLPAARQARVLRQWIETQGLPPLPAQGVRRIRDDLVSAEHVDQPEFAWSGAWVRRWRDQLHAGRNQIPLPADWRVAWDGRSALPLPGGGALRLAGASGFETPVFAVARRGGERITLPGRAHSHALKHVLQDLCVPPWQRERLPLLVDSRDDVLAAGDVVASAAFVAWLDAHGARLEWTRG